MNRLAMSEITGFGHYVPSRQVDNAELECNLSLEAGWIERRTGIKSRRWVNPDEHLIDIAEKAGLAALRNQPIGLLILATSTPDHLLPPTAPLLAERLGLRNCCAFDLAGACTGFIHALIMADSFVRTQRKPALVVAANILSRRLNLSDPNSAIIFGDAAGAIMLSPTQDLSKGLLAASFATDGSQYHAIKINAGGSQQPFSPHLPFSDYKIQLHNGPMIFSQAVTMMIQCANQVMLKAGISTNEIHYLVPHQANARMVKLVTAKLNINQEKVLTTITDYGNSSAASIPLTLSIANQMHPFQSGDKLLLTAAGAGMTSASVIMQV